MDTVQMRGQRELEVVRARIAEHGLRSLGMPFFPAHTGLKIVAHYISADEDAHEIQIQREPHMNDDIIRQKVDAALLRPRVLWYRGSRGRTVESLAAKN